jgi:hypothetical protein
VIALEIFTVLILIGLGVVMYLQFRNRNVDRGHKGDAVKTPEEIRSHQSHS